LRVREPIGRRADRQRHDEFKRLMESGDFSPETMERITQLLGRLRPRSSLIDTD
jgi:hypothetical protein